MHTILKTSVTIGTRAALVLLGFGLGALLVGMQPPSLWTPPPHPPTCQHSP